MWTPSVSLQLPAPTPELAERVLAFCRLLRQEGLAATPAHSGVAVEALRRVDVGDREDFRLALRAVLTSGADELEHFDELFRLFWEGSLETSEALQRAEERESEAVAAEDASAQYSAMEALAHKDFADVQTEEDREALERALRTIARKLAARRSRRMRPTQHGGRVDVRRTIRRSLRFGGTALELARRRRDVRKTRLVLICDVSRSMDQYSRFLLQFVYAFQRGAGQVESFVFGTRLTRVTRYFRQPSIRSAVDQIEQEVLDWSGGTRIGASLAAFNRDYRAAVDRSTTVIVLSDGLDTGDLDVLDEQMALLSRRARRLIWLNPLLGSSPDHALGRGMRRALPYVDTFAPGHNLATLEALAKVL